MIPIGTAIESPQTGERLIFRSTAERFVVLEGRYGWRIGSETGIAEPGETLVCPRITVVRHRHRRRDHGSS